MSDAAHPATLEEPWRAAAAEVARALGPHYQVESLVGRGGYALVFRVRDLRLERTLAVKALIADFAASPELAERFRREARTAARLAHPNIVPIHFVGDETHAPCYAMPLVDGETLGARLAREGALDLGVTLGLARDIAAALDFAHAAGVVHRDVKPDNVLIEQASGRSLLADFGIAKAVVGSELWVVGNRGQPTTQNSQPTTDALTIPGIAFGTPRYMAPEQIVGEAEVDHRADIYSFGVVLYEMLAGRPPFVAGSARALYSMHLLADVPPIDGRPDDTGERVIGALRTAMAKAPDERFASAGALVRALEESAGRRPLRRSGTYAAAVEQGVAHDDMRLFRTLRTRGGEAPLAALAVSSAPAEVAELVEVADLAIAAAAERGDAPALLRLLALLASRADDAQHGVREPVRDVLRRAAARPGIATALAAHWRAANDHAQGTVEQVLTRLIDLHPEPADELVRDARREKAPECFVLADRVGALDDRRAEELARDPGVGVVKAFVAAVAESARTAATVERRLALTMRHANPKARLTVLETVAAHGGAMAERIGRVGLGDADPAVRLAALEAMGASHRREALPDLVRVLEHGPREDQPAAATALGRLGLAGAVAPLTAVFERKSFLRKERGEVQLAAARALAALPRELAGTALAELAKDRDPEIARVAAAAARGER